MESAERSELAREPGREPFRDVGPRDPDLLVGRLPAGYNKSKLKQKRCKWLTQFAFSLNAQ